MLMTNTQLYLAVGIPILFNAAFTTLLFLLTWRHFDQRIDDMRHMWQIELKRVEDVLDARLKHLEGRP
jgi:hypothetical protein